jgi:hypothetical protein
MKHTYLLVALLTLSLFTLGCTRSVPTPDNSPGMTNNTNVPVPTETATSPPASETIASKYSGTVLAGNLSPYLEFNLKDYQKVTADGDVILLYFYTDRNTICVAEESKVFKSFNDMANAKMIGFKVHFEDDYATDSEKELAKSLNITSAHTKVILKNGIIKQKDSRSWDISTYAAQMSSYLDK